MPDPGFLTVGHGTLHQEDMVALLGAAGVESVVDVRTAPGRRHNPQFARGELQRWLPNNGIAYRWDQRLGGLRKLQPDSPDSAWRNDSFRAYAGHMRTDEFREAAEELLAEARRSATAVMCGESVWWRCHRRMIADFAQLARGFEVEHLMHDGKRVPNHPIDGVRLRGDGLLVYDAG